MKKSFAYCNKQVDIEASMPFHAIYDLIQDKYNGKLDEGYKAAVVTASIPVIDAHEVVFLRAHMTTDDPDASELTQSLLHALQMEMWLECGINRDFLARMEGHPLHGSVTKAIDQLMQCQGQDIASLKEACFALDEVYKSFVEQVAPDVFEADIMTQLHWIAVVNDMEDNMSATDTVVRRIGPQQIRQYIFRARDTAKQQLSPEQRLNFETHKALKHTYELLKACADAFQFGHWEEGMGYFGSLHPGLLSAQIEHIAKSQNLTNK